MGVLKQLLPPAVVSFFRRSRQNKWTGNYSSWEAALKASTGYDANLIFNKVSQAALAVQDGKAVFERDSVLFYEETYNWELLSLLLLAASANNGILHVTDFGGSLASSYYQHKKLLAPLKEIKWGIIEQEQFVHFGKQYLTAGPLTFYYKVEECLTEQQAQVLVLSSVLSYLEKPFEIIDHLLKFRFNYIFIDKAAFIRASTHRLTVQDVPACIYKASYPAWFFNEAEFLLPFLKDYYLVTDFENDEYTSLRDTYYKGFFFKRKDL